MKQLAHLQHTFQNRVIDADRSDSISWISASGRSSPETQLSVYKHAYRARLKEVLANDFPAVLMAIGDDYFNGLTSKYISSHPSHYFSLRDFGRGFPGFIAKSLREGTDHHAMSWLVELATFEWTLGLAFDAADIKLFTEQDMALISPDRWPNLTFTLHPSVYRLDFSWNIPEIWQTLTSDNEPDDIMAQPEDFNPWLIWRDQLTTRFRSMPIDEQCAFDEMVAGSTFHDICEALATLINENDVPLHAATLLKGWIVNGLIIAAKE